MSVVLSTEDRKSISGLHGPPTNLRDASQNQSWKKPPTKIETPSNRNVPRVSNPWSTTRTKDTLNNNRGGNVAAQQTLTGYASTSHSGPPPAKRARYDSDGLRSRKKVPQSSNIALPQRKPGQSDDTGLSIVTDEYMDDIGEPISGGPVSDDCELLINPINAASTSRHIGSSRHNPHVIPDGEETKRLRDDVLLAPENLFDNDPEDPDPIESFEQPEQEPGRGQGVVKRRIQDIEKKNGGNQNQPSHPKLDLVAVTREKTNLKNGMKPKHPPSALPTGVPSKLNPTNKPPPNKPPDKTKFLPIKAWYLGHRLFEEPYYLIWNKDKMYIKSGDGPGPSSRHVEELDIGMITKTLFYVESKEVSDKVLVLDTFDHNKKTASQKVIGANYSAYFKQGAKHGQGNIMLKFDSKSSAWADSVYVAFLEWLKPRVDSRHTLRGQAVITRWEAANRMALIADTRVARKEGASSSISKAVPAKAPAVPGLPPLDTWSPSPPPRVAIANTVKAPSGSRRQGSPNTPIEIESPSRPTPRPTYKGADSASIGGGSEIVRRSARQSVAPQKPYVDPDEVILVYPPGQTGAVNITNGDVTRLAPGEFLNDTLIEFGLKLWLQELEKENPELVKQIHVFSSFFYKKLNKKNAQEGYESVRKWTSKFDLFDKKYIIIPINENLHWYLAIIYHPEHTLLPSLPKKSPSTRRKARQEAEKPPECGEDARKLPDSKASSVTRRTPSPVETTGGSGTLSPNSNGQAEAEVVKELTSCSITEDEAPTPEVLTKSDTCLTDDDTNSLFDAPDDLMDIDTVEVLEASQEPSAVAGAPLNDGDSHTASEEPVISEPEIMDVDAPDHDPNQSIAPKDLFADESPSPSAPSISAAVQTTNFYGKSEKSKGKRKAESPLLETFPQQEAFPSELYEDDAEDVSVDGQPSTYVFTLDSLGTRHPKVVSVLGQYLQFEALERKGIRMDRSSKPIGKTALVPHQPNFCDCGIYLLHLAQTFISDPLRYYKLITTKKGNSNSVERQADWNDERTKTLRETLAFRIEELSVEWKKNRAAKELKKKQEDETVPESSDDDVDIVDTTPAPQRKEKVSKTTGKASRLRG